MHHECASKERSALVAGKPSSLKVGGSNVAQKPVLEGRGLRAERARCELWEDYMDISNMSSEPLHSPNIWRRESAL
jgi:hypothetical protein